MLWKLLQIAVFSSFCLFIVVGFFFLPMFNLNSYLYMISYCPIPWRKSHFVRISLQCIWYNRKGNKKNSLPLLIYSLFMIKQELTVWKTTKLRKREWEKNETYGLHRLRLYLLFHGNNDIKQTHRDRIEEENNFQTIILWVWEQTWNPGRIFYGSRFRIDENSESFHPKTRWNECKICYSLYLCSTEWIWWWRFGNQ